MNVIVNDRFPPVVRRALDRAEWKQNHGWDYFAELMESPIETALLEQIFADFVAGDTYGLYLLNCYQHGAERHLNCHSIIVYPQAEVSCYRVDFLLDVLMPGEDRKLFAIECDGHQFHDKTRQQAARDKQRDRALQSEGLQVLRFTGGEIHRDAEGVWREIVDHITGKRGPEWARVSREIA